MTEHVVAHNELTASLPPAAIAQWTREVELWEEDSTKLNPFEATINSEYCATTCNVY